jgi:hypothetical protein
VGGYYGMAMGNLKEKDQNGVASEKTHETAGFKKAEYGVVGSVGLRIPAGSSVSLIADGRYVMALSNQVDSPVAASLTSYKASDLQAFVGLQFGMMK